MPYRIFFTYKKISNAIFAENDPISMLNSAFESSFKYTSRFVSQICSLRSASCIFSTVNTTRLAENFETDSILPKVKHVLLVTSKCSISITSRRYVSRFRTQSHLVSNNKIRFQNYHLLFSN